MLAPTSLLLTAPSSCRCSSCLRVYGSCKITRARRSLFLCRKVLSSTCKCGYLTHESRLLQSGAILDHPFPRQLFKRQSFQFNGAVRRRYTLGRVDRPCAEDLDRRASVLALALSAVLPLKTACPGPGGCCDPGTEMPAWDEKLTSGATAARCRSGDGCDCSHRLWIARMLGVGAGAGKSSTSRRRGGMIRTRAHRALLFASVAQSRHDEATGGERC